MGASFSKNPPEREALEWRARYHAACADFASGITPVEGFRISLRELGFLRRDVEEEVNLHWPPMQGPVQPPGPPKPSKHAKLCLVGDDLVTREHLMKRLEWTRKQLSEGHATESEQRSLRQRVTVYKYALGLT